MLRTLHSLQTFQKYIFLLALIFCANVFARGNEWRTLPDLVSPQGNSQERNSQVIFQSGFQSGAQDNQVQSAQNHSTPAQETTQENSSEPNYADYAAYAAYAAYANPNAWAAQNYSAQNYQQQYQQNYAPQNYAAYQNPYAQTYAPQYQATPYAQSSYGAIDPNYALMLQQQSQIQQQQLQWQQQQQLQLQQKVLMNALIEREANRLATDDAPNAEETATNSWNMGSLAPVKVSSPLIDSMWVGAGYMNPFSSVDGPNRGVGCPLELQSWLDRPYYAGGFVGWSGGGALVKDLIKQDSGGTFGLILGKNYSYYWGFEGRLHFASLGERLTDAGKLLPNAAAIEGQANQITMCDVSAHYYPLGNSQWRPFFKWGFGFAGESFVDATGNRKTHSSGLMPLGLGLRYWWNDRFGLTTELVDNIIFQTNGIATQHNVALSFGLSYSFGANKMRRPTAYWPYTPSAKK